MEDTFDNYAINIDSDVISQDFDNVDLYGDKELEENVNNFEDELQYE